MKKFKFYKTNFRDLYRVQRKPFVDNRGTFVNLFQQEFVNYFKLESSKSQINFSFNKSKGILRGMHFQIPPYAEKKIITCVQGSVFDVVIDLRKKSKTFLKFYSEILNANDFNSLLVPEGFAHGYQVLEDNTQLVYIHSNNYNKRFEKGVNSLDPVFGINWPLEKKIISDKDSCVKYLSANFNGFEI